MEKNKIFESLIRCLLSNILVSFLLFIRIRETRENETKRRKKERLIRDSDIILINRQNNRPIDNRYFSKFYARSIFFPLLGYLTSPWFKFCRLKRFSCFTLRTVVAIACWLTISEKYCRKFPPKPCFHSHLTNTSLINIPHHAICVVAITIVISSSFPFFFSHSTMFFLVVF